MFKRIHLKHPTSNIKLEVIIKNGHSMHSGETSTLSAEVNQEVCNGAGIPEWITIRRFPFFNEIPGEQSRLCAYFGELIELGYERIKVTNY